MKLMIKKMLVKMDIILLLIILVCVAIIDVFNYQTSWRGQTFTLFEQVEHILEKNTIEQKKTIADYKQICLNYADAVTYILDKNPEIMDDIDELKKIAKFMQIDEIHVFDETGRIVKGTDPQYYNLTVYDGDQIGYFKSMLKSKNLRLCQEVTPNTAEEKNMQYAAVWSESGTYFVQVGISPDRVLEVISKNQLSYIFSLLTPDDGTELYAVSNTGEILGSTNSATVGKTVEELGLDTESVKKSKNAFFGEVSGIKSYCVADRNDSVILLRTCSLKNLYKNLGKDITTILACLIVSILVTGYFIERFLHRNIVQGIYDINRNLKTVSEGDVEQVVSVNNTPEFELLSNGINRMKKSILRESEKLSYVLNHASLPMGVFEFSTVGGRVRTSGQVKSVLGMDEQQAEALFSDCSKFKKCMEELKAAPVEDFAHTYRLKEEEERYVRMEFFEDEEDIVGIVIDVSNTVLEKRRIERERDLDKLTGLYNRRALEGRLEALFAHPKALGYSALVMLDADGLKQINDRYEHKAGDKYLCRIAELLKSIQGPDTIVARQGGDEFVLFCYGCSNEEEVMEYLSKLDAIRDRETFSVDDDTVLPVRYSFGYTMCYGRNNSYSDLLREADLKMYNDKKKRKGHLHGNS